MKYFSYLIFAFLLLSCKNHKTTESKNFVVNFNIESPSDGEVIVFIKDSLKTHRDMWKPYYKVDSIGVAAIVGEIYEPEFYYFQLGKTPVFSDLIIFPGDTIDIFIQGTSLVIKSNEHQKKLDYLNNIYSSLNESERTKSITKELSESVVLLKAFERWRYEHELKPEIVKISKKFNENYSDLYITNQINDLVKKIQKLNLNKEAPNFTQTSYNNNYISLNNFRGKYILIDFWGSWCKPCIENLPKMKEIYKNFTDYDIEFIGIANDTKSNWTKSITKYNLQWINIIDENNVISELYNIKSYPSTFLIDPNGKIIAKNLRPSTNLTETLNSIFNIKQ